MLGPCFIQFRSSVFDSGGIEWNGFISARRQLTAFNGTPVFPREIVYQTVNSDFTGNSAYEECFLGPRGLSPTLSISSAVEGVPLTKSICVFLFLRFVTVDQNLIFNCSITWFGNFRFFDSCLKQYCPAWGDYYA